MPAAKPPKSTAITAKVIKAMNLPRLEAFRRADLTPELREKVGLTAEDEHRLTACVELNRLGLPIEAAEALAFGGAVGSASEFASLTLAELERVFEEEPIKRRLPSGFLIDRTVIEDWIRRATPLTADESAPGRSAVPETETLTLGRDEDLALAAEDLPVNAERVNEMLTSLKENWRRTETAIKALTGAPVDGLTLRAALADLQGEIAQAIERTITPAADGFVADDEIQARSFADEGLDPSVEMQRLREETVRIEAVIEALRTLTASGSEETSPAAATETGVSERETSTRGE